MGAKHGNFRLLHHFIVLSRHLIMSLLILIILSLNYTDLDFTSNNSMTWLNTNQLTIISHYLVLMLHIILDGSKYKSIIKFIEI